jgi:hypothetical protein
MTRWTTKGESSFIIEVTPIPAEDFSENRITNKMCGPHGHHNIDPQEDLHIRFQHYGREDKGKDYKGEANTRRGVANQLAIFGELMKPMKDDNEDIVARVTRLKVRIRRVGPIEKAGVPDRPKDKLYDMSEKEKDGENEPSPPDPPPDPPIIIT